MTTSLDARFTKEFEGGFVIEATLSPTQRPGAVMALFGPSGCGKTTILRCLAGLERPRCGFIRLGGVTWFDSESRIDMSPQVRRVGYLSQDDALFPNMTVRENVSYGIGDRLSQKERHQVSDLLARFAVDHLAERRPRELSGGQRQRVALARALARRPHILLLDEPLSALDAPARETLRHELRRWLVAFSIPTVLVTHDRIEVETLADEVTVMNHGRTLTQGPVMRTFRRPESLEVARVLGFENIFAGSLSWPENGLGHFTSGPVTFAVSRATATPEGSSFACIRGEDVLLSSPEASEGLVGHVTALDAEGPLVRVAVECGLLVTALLRAPEARALDLRVGARVRAWVAPDAVHLVPS